MKNIKKFDEFHSLNENINEGFMSNIVDKIKSTFDDFFSKEDENFKDILSNKYHVKEISKEEIKDIINNELNKENISKIKLFSAISNVLFHTSNVAAILIAFYAYNQNFKNLIDSLIDGKTTDKATIISTVVIIISALFYQFSKKIKKNLTARSVINYYDDKEKRLNAYK